MLPSPLPLALNRLINGNIFELILYSEQDNNGVSGRTTLLKKMENETFQFCLRYQSINVFGKEREREEYKKEFNLFCETMTIFPP